MRSLLSLLALLGPATLPVDALAAGWKRVSSSGGGGRGLGPPRNTDRPIRRRSKADFAETRIFVENLNYDTTWTGLKEHFLSYGYPVAYVSISEMPSGESKGCGLVQFEEPEAATDAIERMTGTELDGRRINCRRDVQSADRRSKGDQESWKDKPWNRVPGTLDDTKQIDEEVVKDLLARRDAAREIQDFVTADALLDKLEDLDVHLDDARRQRTWWLGWRAGTEGSDREVGRSGNRMSRGRRTWYNSLEENWPDRDSGRNPGRSEEVANRRGSSRFTSGDQDGRRSAEQGRYGGVNRGASGGGRSAFSGSQNVKRGDWQCNACGANVFARKTECFNCGAPRGNAKGYFGSTDDEFD